MLLSTSINKFVEDLYFSLLVTGMVYEYFFIIFFVQLQYNIL